MCQLKPLTTKDGDIVEVASIKQDAIVNIIASASICSSIETIILFGSSLEERCTSDSDIDIVIISDKSVSGLSKLKSFKEFMNRVYLFDMNQEYDRLYYKSLDSIKELADNVQICREIVNNGKVIYRRDAA